MLALVSSIPLEAIKEYAAGGLAGGFLLRLELGLLVI